MRHVSGRGGCIAHAASAYFQAYFAALAFNCESAYGGSARACTACVCRRPSPSPSLSPRAFGGFAKQQPANGRRVACRERANGGGSAGASERNGNLDRPDRSV